MPVWPTRSDIDTVDLPLYACLKGRYWGQKALNVNIWIYFLIGAISPTVREKGLTGMLKRTGYAIFWAVVMLLPALLALWLTQNAREQTYFGDPIRYTQHEVPKGEADSILKRLGYDNMTGNFARREVPRVFLSRLPENLPDIKSIEQRKQLFSAILLPLILRVNELILGERERLILLKEKVAAGERLAGLEHMWLRQLADKYRVKRDGPVDGPEFAVLMRRVNIIPPSLALAQAAIESGWGTSRFAQTGNALYGQWTWNDDDDAGIVPEGREEGKTHRIKAFDYLIHSVESYANNLNRHPAYRSFRGAREQAILLNVPISGRALAETLVAYSQRREAYVEELQSMISVNDWSPLDETELQAPANFLTVQGIANVVPAAGGNAPGE